MKLIFSNSQRDISDDLIRTNEIDEAINPIFRVQFESHRVVGANLMQLEESAQFQEGIDASQQSISINGETLAVRFSYDKIVGEFQIKGLSKDGLESLNIDISKDLIRFNASHDSGAKTCIVTCGDGTQGSPCVNCKAKNGQIFQVCC